jgi:hypothetical protein
MAIDEQPGLELPTTLESRKKMEPDMHKALDFVIERKASDLTEMIFGGPDGNE